MKKIDKTVCINPKGGRKGIPNLQPSRKDRIYDSRYTAATIATSEFYNPAYLVIEWKGNNYEKMA